MSNVLLRIEVNPDAESEKLGDITNYVDSTGTNANIANTSYQTDDNGLYGDDAEGKSSGFNGLSLAQPLVFNSEGYLDNADKNGGVLGDEENPTEFIWGAVPESGEYSVKLVFSNATNLKDIVVYGDEKAQQFPTTAIVDGTTTIYNDDYRWAISMEEASDTHTIEFTNWNKVNYNACLSGITVMLRYYDVDKSAGLTSIENLAQSTSDANEVNFGVVPSTGSAEILDNKGELKDLITDGIVSKTRTDVNIVFNDKIVAKTKITNLTASDTSNSIKLTLGDIFDYFDNQKYSSNGNTYLDLSLYNSRTLLGLTSDRIYSKFGYNSSDDVYNLMQNIIYYEDKGGITVYEHLHRFKVIPYFPNLDNFNDLLDMVCEVAGLNLSLDNDGNLKFTYAFPKRLDLYGDKNAIRIPPKYQYSTIERSLISDTVYDNTIFSRKTMNKKVAYVVDESFDITNLANAIYNGEDYSTIATEIFGEKATVEADSDGNYYVDFYYSFSSNTNCFDVFNYSYASGSSIYPFYSTITYTKNGSSGSGGEEAGTIAVYTDTAEIGNFDFTKLISSGAYRLSQYATPTSQRFAVKIEIPISAKYSSYSVGLKLGAYHYAIDTVSEDETYNEGENVYDLPDNDFMVTNTVYNDKKTAYEFLSDNIIESFSNGVNTLEITVSASDYYATNGTLMLDASQGEIFDIDDMVVIDKDNDGNSRYVDKNGMDIVWRVTGRTFRKEGVPYIDLELQQVPNNDTMQIVITNQTDYTTIDDVEYREFTIYPKLSTTKVYYTLDKSIPTKNSNLYDGRTFLVGVDETLYIYAVAYENDLQSKYSRLTIGYTSLKVSDSTTAKEWT